ncbi:exopolyphosphatase/guanosine-5'-triphosphate,3'-diphosphate pyrophosphatase [Porphyrobacter sp. MBR-155]|jgi:exopolyphosphatase/guanosine-5'-triphosphate,3'-diphosphate pyrophosphatase|uniref:Ppx/GppA phosphatase family protein n=1 Tax=Porphyrobacter sp. MBR-155 TaxID=3156464 RepID=UPI0033961A69
MAEFLPPDRNSKAGTKRGGKSGKVADFRYKRPPQQDCRKTGRDGRGSGEARQSRTAPDLSTIGTARGNAHGEAYAALDLGTNNCRLLIARPSGRDFTVIDAFSRVVKLGEGLAASGRLSDKAMDRTLAALTICADKLQRRNVRLARSVATEACRRAENGYEFIERVRRETGIALDIISAEEEARLAVLGCHILLESGDGPAVIFDIGGGSTELVLVEPGGMEASRVPRILDWHSVPWGVVSLTDTVGRSEDSEPARAARYAAMRRMVSDSFAPFAARVAQAAQHDDIRLLGTSGTVTTLASLYLELPSYDRKAVDGLIVPAPAMRDISARLSAMTPYERSNLPCIGQDRADLVVAGCAILEAILDLWPARRLGVADRGIREGILRSIMASQHQSERTLRQLHKQRSGRSAQ